jgi:hypothetical protein
MTREEAASAAKAVYLQAASMAGKEVAPDSPEGLAVMVQDGLERVDENRRQEAVANFLRLLAAVIESPVGPDNKYHESNVYEGQKKTCPVYPFD